MELQGLVRCCRSVVTYCSSVDAGVVAILGDNTSAEVVTKSVIASELTHYFYIYIYSQYLRAGDINCLLG